MAHPIVFLCGFNFFRPFLISCYFFAADCFDALRCLPFLTVAPFFRARIFFAIAPTLAGVVAHSRASLLLARSVNMSGTALKEAPLQKNPRTLIQSLLRNS